MKFSVKRVETYTLNKESLKKFKESVVELLNEEDETDTFTLDIVTDEIVEAALKETIQTAFQEGGNGVSFDDYFNTISLDCGEDDVADAVHEAAALVREN